MRKLVVCTAAIAALAWSAPAFAQQSAPPAATTGATADTTAAASGLSVGLSVKDKAGVTVGQIAELKTDPGGKRWAKISMGADTVSIEADKLTAKDGAASVDLTQAELKAKAGKPKT